MDYKKDIFDKDEIEVSEYLVDIEDDYVVKIPPKNKCKIKIKIKNIKKGKPRLIDPEDFWDIDC